MSRAHAVILIWLATALGLACGRTSESVPHEPAESSGPREVRLAEDALRAAGVEVIAVAPEAFHPHVVASGVIRPLSQKSVTVRSRVAGRVVRVLADVGDRVREGAPLATIEGPDVTAAVARSRTATARQESARRALGQEVTP